MHRLTTDTPKDNFGMALNLFYVKDEEVWARGYGKDGADISLLNLTREILSHQCPYVESDIMTLMRLRELAVADQEGRVTILPCRGDADIVLMRNGVAFKPDHWNIHLTTFAENQPTPSGKKVALFDLREVRESMEDKG